MSIHTYQVPDIMCSACAGTITGALSDTPFKDYARIDVLTKTLTVQLKDDEEAFKDLDVSSVDELVCSALRKVGFDCIPSKVVVKRKKSLSHATKGVLGLAAGAILLLLPLIFTTIPFAWMCLLSLFSAGLTIALGRPFYRRAYYEFWKGTRTMDTLFSISTAVILGVSLAALFIPALPMMFEAGLLIFGFRHTGIAMSDAFKAKLLRVRRLQEDAPQKVRLADGKWVSLDAVKPGDCLLLSPGDMLGVDGRFESGVGLVSSLYQTGSNQSKPLVLGQLYPAGTKLVSISAPLLFRVTAAANDSFLAREDCAILSAKINQALEKKPLNSITYWLQFFVPMIVGVAGLSGLLVGLYFSSWVLAIQIVACGLVLGCPCTLGLIIPLVTHVGVKKIEKTGISMREPERLEVLEKVDCIMLDLNGTLTCGRPKVKNLDANQALLMLMARLEEKEEHWAAVAIRDAANELTKHLSTDEVKALKSGPPFEGGACKALKSTHNGRRVLFKGKDGAADKEYVLGNRLMMKELGISDAALDVRRGALGESVVYLAEDGKLVGHLVLEDKIRDGAYEMVRGLQAQGKKVCLCTGSDEKTAKDYATAFGIPVDKAHVFSDCTIEGNNSKQAHLERLKKQGHHVMMIGDAGNDARVVAKSHFGLVVAHEGGNTGTQQGAHAVLLSESLLPILGLFKISRKTSNHIKQNIAFSFAYNAMAMSAPAVLSIGFGLVLNPAVGAALMIVQTLLIFANVYRFDAEKISSSECQKVTNTSKKGDVPTALRSGANNILDFSVRKGLLTSLSGSEAVSESSSRVSVLDCCL